MNNRQHKKLCKKSAELLGFRSCDSEDGLYHVHWSCTGMDFTEWDSQPAWDWLLGVFNVEVNTSFDGDEMHWKEDSESIKPTPRNVFDWAKSEDFKYLN